MDFISIIRIFFGILIIIILYVIIVYSLRIMYKDVKVTTNTKEEKKIWAFEVVSPGGAEVLKKGSVVPIKNEITIGRSSTNEIELKDNFVSSEHAILAVKDDECLLIDLNSTNGTYVNGDKAQDEVILSEGDLVKIGKFIFKIII